MRSLALLVEVFCLILHLTRCCLVIRWGKFKDMKEINKANLDKAPKILYMVKFNLGMLNNKIYKLSYKRDGEWWDDSGNHDFGIKLDENSFYNRKVIRLNKVFKDRCVWKFVTDDKNKAELFFNGAKTSLKFINETWLRYYEK